MSLLSILTYPDPILLQKAAPVTAVTNEIRKLIDDMFETMYDAPGVGLAAPQVGVSQRILVIDVGTGEEEKRKPNPCALINPEIVQREGKIIWEEGCLSCPSLLVPVERAQKIKVRGLGRDDRALEIEAFDLFAVAFQHEIDHLDGITLANRLSRLKRSLYLDTIKKGISFSEGAKTSSKSRRYVG